MSNKTRIDWYLKSLSGKVIGFRFCITGNVRLKIKGNRKNIVTNYEIHKVVNNLQLKRMFRDIK